MGMTGGEPQLNREGAKRERRKTGQTVAATHKDGVHSGTHLYTLVHRSHLAQRTRPHAFETISVALGVGRGLSSHSP